MTTFEWVMVAWVVVAAGVGAGVALNTLIELLTGFAQSIIETVFHSFFASFDYEGSYFWAILDDEILHNSRVIWQKHAVEHDGSIMPGDYLDKYSPAPGLSRFIVWKGIPILVIFKGEEGKNKNRWDFASSGHDARLTMLAAHRKRFIQSISKVEKYRYKGDKEKVLLEVLIHDGNRWHHRDIVPRTWENVYIDPEPLDQVTKWVKFFVGNEEEWTRRGVPYRTGIMLEGPPGTGKTSLVQAIANEIGYSIRVLNLSEMSNASLRNAISSYGNKSVFLIEDLSAITLMTQRSRVVRRKKHRAHDSTMKSDADEPDIVDPSEEEEEEETGVTLDGLLNAVDGILSPERCIFIYTANEKLNLDEALMRPGRIDLMVHIGYASRHQIRRMFQTFYPEDAELADRFASCYPEKTYSMAEIQDVLLKTRRSHRAITFSEDVVKGSKGRMDLRSLVPFDPS